MGKYTNILKKKFGYSSFRPKQLTIIKAIIKEKKDVNVTMFTGAGKSLCYQYPPVYKNKTAIVISPLISLMNDQQYKLEQKNIPVVCLNSTVFNKFNIVKDIMKNKYRIVYCTPEYIINSDDFLQELREMN